MYPSACVRDEFGQWTFPPCEHLMAKGGCRSSVDRACCVPSDHRHPSTVLTPSVLTLAPWGDRCCPDVFPPC